MIKKGDIVQHIPSGLYYICENAKHERWMNESGWYAIANHVVLPKYYFYKSI